ncbi:hypothetical protein [Methanothermobacter sp.]|uniref:hypothetical protein n=1 Tax=Methanothermobacter sp. TaxID=1884223 RepID=UPI0026153FED|nr:hypothetical protein [Methanothermobacter sp.]MDI9615087.1 hypothetical protein [Methanothermobacter sp.]
MWHELTVTFQLRSPLHIGYLPSRSSIFSPTRYYVPGRTLWGALTRSITESIHRHPGGADYRSIGHILRENFRFSYFYVHDGRTYYLPEYRDHGLIYGGLDIYEFEGRFIASTVSTALRGGVVLKGSLHETEYINNIFHDGEKVEKTRIMGCIWVKNSPLNLEIRKDGIFIGDINILHELTLGGESKYGFGKVVLESIRSGGTPFRVDVSNDIQISDEFLRGHMRYTHGLKFNGDLELVSGRAYFDPERSNRPSEKPGGVIIKPEYYLTPGTQIEDYEEASLCWDGSIKFPGLH